MPRILVFGASIAHGMNDFEKGGWVERLKLYWAKKEGQFNQVINLGNSGDISTDILNRIKNESKARMGVRPKLHQAILIQIGTNDSQYIIKENVNKVPVEVYVSNLKSIIETANHFTENVILVTLPRVDDERMNPMPWNPNNAYLNIYIDEYNAAMKSVSQETNTPLIELPQELDVLLDDGVHPSSEGHELIFQTVKDFLEENKII